MVQQGDIVAVED